MDQGRAGKRPAATWKPVEGRAVTAGSPLDQAQPQSQELSEPRGPTSWVQGTNTQPEFLLLWPNGIMPILCHMSFPGAQVKKKKRIPLVLFGYSQVYILST